MQEVTGDQLVAQPKPALKWVNHLPNHLRSAFAKHWKARELKYYSTLSSAIMGMHWGKVEGGTDFWGYVFEAAWKKELGQKVKWPHLPTLLLLLFSGLLNAQTDTISLYRTDDGVTYRQFSLENVTLKAAFPGETNLVEIGSPTRNTEQLGVIPGHHTWGVDSNFCYRIVGLEYEIAIEIYLPKLGVTLQYGDPALLYLAPEPAAITAFKQVIAIQRANRARDKLLREFSKRFNCSQGYVAPAAMPTNSCRI
jgi:hypothetical protein